jgi:hypothetical protein
MFEAESMLDVPKRITPALVAKEFARYPRSLVMLEDHGGWAVYAASDGKQRTAHRRNWIAALLDLAAILPMVTQGIQFAPMAHVEGRV